MGSEHIVWLKETEYGDLVDYREAAVYLGYGEQMPDEAMLRELRQCADRLLAVLRPRYMFVPVRLLPERDPQGNLMADFGGELLSLPGRAVASHLGDGGLAVAACLTLGRQVDVWIDGLQKESMLEALLTDALANAAVERLRAALEQEVGKTLGIPVGWLFGIGYGDLPIGLQADFLQCIRAGEGIGLSVNAQKILSPLKSVTGFMNVAKESVEGKKRCDGRCGTCPQREKCRIFP